MLSTTLRYGFVCLLALFAPIGSFAGICPGLDGGPGDFDGDGLPAAVDCNDEDLSLQSSPGVAADLRIQGTSISWMPPRDPGGTAAPIYNLYRAAEATFVSSDCIGTALDQPFGADTDLPQPGGIFFYLVETENACGGSGVGTDSSGQPRVALQCECSSVCDDSDACTLDSCGAGACLNEPIPPIVRRAPGSATACDGGSADFSVQAEGSGNLSYSWTVNGFPIGPDAPVLRLSSLSPAVDDGAEIRVEITDGCASTLTEPARLSVLADANSCVGGLDGQEAPNGATRAMTDVGPVKWMAPEMLRRNGPGGSSSWRLNKLRGAVHGHSGEYTRTELDLFIPGRMYSFAMTRTYRSRELVGGVLGPQWTHGYERFVAPDPNVQGNLLLHDGTTGRVDSYSPSPTLQDCFESPGFFRTLCVQPTGLFVLTFADGLEWIFAPLDGLPDEGKIVSSVDRNGNNMTFQYDPQGQLSTVVDTLGRPIDFSYDLNGQLAAVTDFTGRSVTYDYYEQADVGGSPGDLKSVTSPTVTGTVTGNDFPNGKTRTYRYSTGFADFRLNHNLLTVSDDRGGVYVFVRYGATELPADGRYDRVSETVWYPDCDDDGLYTSCDSSGKTVSYVYAVLPFDSAVSQAVSSTVVTDRAGNVSRYDYDGNAQLLRVRQHTGRAQNPDAPSDTLSNAPANPLRVGDPAVYDTLYVYGGDALVTQIQPPNGSSTQLLYDTGHPDRRLRGRLLERTVSPGPLGGDQTSITESWTYDDPYGLNAVPSLETLIESPGSGPNVAVDTHAARLADTYTDGRSQVTTYDYDPAGNVVLWQAPQVVTGTLGGAPQTIEQTTVYNSFGQPIEVTTAGGRVDTFTYYATGASNGYLENAVTDASGAALTVNYRYDAAGNVTRLTDPRGNATRIDYNELDQPVRVTEPAPFLYATDTWYDAEDRVVRVDRTNVDENGTARPNAYLSDGYNFDGLDRLVGSSSETDAGGVCVSERFAYDANDNVSRHESGEATNGTQPENAIDRIYDERDLLFQTARAAGTPDVSTTQRDYDSNGNLAVVRVGLQGAAGSRDTQYLHDGYSRMVLRTDAEGNTLTRNYDGNSNIVSERVNGELIQGTGQQPVLLSEKNCVFDEIDRVVRCETTHFIADTGSPIGDGQSAVNRFYDPDDRVVRIEDDNRNGVDYLYDSSRRLSTATDAAGNRLTYEYDANSNVNRTTHFDVSGLGQANETFVTDYGYDTLNRHISTTDNDGEVWQVFHDSQHDRPLTVDPLGNSVRTLYDGLHRPLEIQQEMTDTGTGAGSVVDVLITQQTWDDNHRLVSRTDDNGNTTNFLFDAFDDLLRADLPDGRFQRQSYDVYRDRVLATDANGTIVSTGYDRLHRPVSVSVAPAAGVGGTTFENFRYDGLSRLRDATDDDSVVTFAYDSLGNVAQETQQISGGTVRTVSQSFDGASNRLQLNYPGGRTIDYTYDGLNRVSSVLDGQTNLSGYIYLGPQRVEFRTHGSGATTQYEYDGLGRMTRTLHTVGGNPGVDFGSSYDPLGNLTQLSDDLTPGRFREYTYDSIYRLIESVRNEPGQSPSPESYLLDGMGNRESVTGGPEAGVYTLDATLPDPGDFQCNQYTETPRGTRTYDDNGATLTADDRSNMIYDHADRLLSVTTPLGTTEFVYDALGRRLRAADATSFRIYAYSGGSVIEELDGAGVSQITYVDGAGDLAEIREEADQNSDAVLDRYSVHRDYNDSTRALSTAAGGVVELYEYDDYGLPQVFDGAGTPLGNASRRGNPYLFQGARWDDDSRLYVHGSGYYDPSAGRNLTRGVNPLYVGSTNEGSNPMYQPSGAMYGGGSGGSGGRGQLATDYNSSRSNKQGIVAGNGNTSYGTAGGGGRGQEATDYNSSRSNKQGIVAGNGNTSYGTAGGGGRGQEATDYNSSRSNKQGIVAGNGNTSYGTAGGGGRGQEATDYNSSRSNKQGIVAGNGNTSYGTAGGGGRGQLATDYNSSRSNKQGIAAGNGNTSGGSGSGGRGQEATDYNSSRSNKQGIAAGFGDTSGTGGGNGAVQRKGYDHYQALGAQTLAAPPGGGLSTGAIAGIVVGARAPGGGGLSTGAIAGIVVGAQAHGGGDDNDLRVKLVGKR